MGFKFEYEATCPVRGREPIHLFYMYGWAEVSVDHENEPVIELFVFDDDRPSELWPMPQHLVEPVLAWLWENHDDAIELAADEYRDDSCIRRPNDDYREHCTYHGQP